MSHARVALLCACALITSTGVHPAPPRRADSAESKMAQEKSIVIKRIPSAYFYPFSLWPLPKFPVKDSDESYEEMYNMRRLKNVLVQKNKR